ncbi:MAG TPA: TraR/DksA C4-type zinc finger protein [Pyrinomonadaceae bacterium]|nr:TraR/DksA C4-type zinc finger protein [Pyrinomonadaceae bacterium]
MSANLNFPLDNPVKRNGGGLWQRLRSEREDICDALLTDSAAGHEVPTEDAMQAANWHRELLQARLRKVDDALDRLMAGSFGNCSKCGRWIEDTKLDFDPAVAFCLDCWGRMQIQH